LHYKTFMKHGNVDNFLIGTLCKKKISIIFHIVLYSCAPIWAKAYANESRTYLGTHDNHIIRSTYPYVPTTASLDGLLSRSPPMFEATQAYVPESSGLVSRS